MTEKETDREDIFLAKLMCERQGKAKKIPLGVAYWNTKDWKLEFKKQILAANKLLKIYPFSVICLAVNNKKMSWVYSLNYPGLKQILEEELNRYERKLVIEAKREEHKAKTEEFEIVQTEQAPTILDEKKSLKSRLD